MIPEKISKKPGTAWVREVYFSVREAACRPARLDLENLPRGDLSMARQFYREDDAYLLATGRSPKGFAGIACIVWAGTLDGVEENVRTLDQLKALAPVADQDVPDDWWTLYVEATGLIKERKPEPASFEEFAGHCAVGTDIATGMVVSGYGLEDEPAVPDDNEDANTVKAFVCLVVATIIVLGCLA
jgi:hypothetical protein